MQLPVRGATTSPGHAPREENTMSTFDRLAIPGRLEALLASERGGAPSRAELKAATDLGDALASQIVARTLEDEVSAPADARRAERAAALAGELRLTAASAALVRCIERPENDLLGWQAFRTLEAIGAAALEPLLAAFASTKDPEVCRRTAELLVVLQEDAAAGACRVADYGDPCLVPALERALNAAALDGPPDEPGEDDPWREPHGRLPARVSDQDARGHALCVPADQARRGAAATRRPVRRDVWRPRGAAIGRAARCAGGRRRPSEASLTDGSVTARGWSPRSPSGSMARRAAVLPRELRLARAIPALVHCLVAGRGSVGLIRFRGRQPRGGYGVRHGARQAEAAAA
jgi:hypothetical protein